VALYQHPPEGSHVICLDEMGPVAVKDYPATRWSPGQWRPHFLPSYERRGKVWVYGAMEPATGEVLTASRQGRSSQEMLEFLDSVDQHWPQGTVHVILDNLSSHKTLYVLLWVWGHRRFALHFQPTYAPWLNLMEPWWKKLKHLALDGSAYTCPSHLGEAIAAATAYWNSHKHPYSWKKAT
jgi:transposase